MIGHCTYSPLVLLSMCLICETFNQLLSFDNGLYSKHWEARFENWVQVKGDAPKSILPTATTIQRANVTVAHERCFQRK